MKVRKRQRTRTRKERKIKIKEKKKRRSCSLMCPVHQGRVTNHSKQITPVQNVHFRQGILECRQGPEKGTPECPLIWRRRGGAEKTNMDHLRILDNTWEPLSNVVFCSTVFFTMSVVHKGIRGATGRLAFLSGEAKLFQNVDYSPGN